MANIDKVVSAVSNKNIASAVNKVVEKHDTPAYDLVGYFSRLDSCHQLSESELKHLKSLLTKHKGNPFIKEVLSLKIRIYMKTHRSKVSIEQKFCSTLGMIYKYRGNTLR